MSNMLQGNCLCGKIRVQATFKNLDFGACHCHMCRKWNQGSLMSLNDSPSELSLDGQEYLSVYDSSEWAQRSFCKVCGTHVYYRLKGSDEYFFQYLAF